MADQLRAVPRCAAGGQVACPDPAVAELLLLFNYRGRTAIRWTPRCERHLASWDENRIRPLRGRESAVQPCATSAQG